MARAELLLTLLILGFLGFVALFPGLLTHRDPWRTGGPALMPPGLGYPLGTDALGRDVWARVVYGGRTSILVGFLATGVTLLVGGAMGLLAGALGGWADELLMRLAEFVDSVPALPLALLLVALTGPSLLPVALVIGLTGWVGLARVLRAELVSLRERDFVLAARALGVGGIRLALRHLLPNALPPVLALLPFRFEAAILTEASLSFLGLGDTSRPSWGGLLRDAQPFLREGWWLFFAPALALALTLFALSLLADALHRSTTPRLRPQALRGMKG